MMRQHSAHAGTVTPLPRDRVAQLHADARRLCELPQAEFQDIFDPGCADRCMHTLGGLATLGLLAPAPGAVAADAVPPQGAASTERFVLVPHGVIEAPASGEHDAYVAALLGDAPAAAAPIEADPLPAPPPGIAQDVTVTAGDESTACRYDVAAWCGWLGYWDHIAHVRLAKRAVAAYAPLFPFRAAKEALLTRLVVNFSHVQERFAAEAERGVAAAGGALDAAARARLASKYGQYAAAYDAMLARRLPGARLTQRLQKLTRAGARPSGLLRVPLCACNGMRRHAASGELRGVLQSRTKRTSGRGQMKEQRATLRRPRLTSRRRKRSGVLGSVRAVRVAVRSPR